ncbi:hypothetical protein D3C71_1464520 [compost metagenome]
MAQELRRDTTVVVAQHVTLAVLRVDKRGLTQMSGQHIGAHSAGNPCDDGIAVIARKTVDQCAMALASGLTWTCQVRAQWPELFQAGSQKQWLQIKAWMVRQFLPGFLR